MRVVSNTVAEFARHFKVSVDDRAKRIDVVVRRGDGISETLAKDDVSVVLWIPQLEVNCNPDMEIDCATLDGVAGELIIEGR